MKTLAIVDDILSGHGGKPGTYQSPVFGTVYEFPATK